MENAPLTGQALHVVELQAENVMRLKAIRIIPDDKVVILGGENEQGKSTVLRCIEMAISGAKAIPDVPIRKGERKAKIVVDLGEIVIERTFDSKGTKLVVRNADGVQQTSPQSILDKLYSKVAFDPLAFSTQKPAEQLATLKRIVGLDFAAEDNRRKKLYDDRTGVGRRIDDAEVRFAQFPTSLVDAPDAEVSVAELLKEKAAADTENAKHEKVRQALAVAQAARDAALAAEQAAAKALAEAQGRLARAEEDLEFANVAVADLPPDEDTALIIAAITGAEDANRKARAKQERAKVAADLKKLEEEKQRLTDEIASIDADKTARMAAAKWPIPGLGFSEDGVTLDGLPFEQASKAQRMKASLAIGMEQNPQLRVLLLQDASLLDKASMAVVHQFADDNNMQIWIERVGDGDQGAIIIEDGEVRE